MYADSVTPSMKVAITETQRRREIQNKYNVEHGIVPKTIVKKVSDILEISTHDDSEFKNTKKLSKAQKQQLIEKLTKEMKAAAKLLEFEHAAYLRDKIKNCVAKNDKGRVKCQERKPPIMIIPVSQR